MMYAFKLINYLNNNLYFLLFFLNNKLMGIGDWGLGIGDWGMGVWAQSPIPTPQTPTPNPQPPF